MKLFDSIPFTKSELVTGILTLVVVFVMSFISRQMRITGSDSISSEKGIELILHDKTGIDDLAEMLLEKKAIEDKDELLWVGKMLGWRTFRRGRYVIDGAYSYNVFLSKLARGIQDPVSVTILPGTDIQRFSDQLSKNLSFDIEAVEGIFEDEDFLASLQLNKGQLFGRMLPNTYLMYWTVSPEEAVNRILNEFESTISNPFSAVADELDLTIDEVTALASIVEWEAEHEEEKARISGLYWNRLNKNMYLQADPTVNFAVGERRRLLFEDYEVDHPYNTYRNKGLPPSAVTNPGISSIKAALEPEQHSYIYMVANPEGGHIFTRTFEEHQVESEKWRKWLRKQFRLKREKEVREGTSSD